MRLFSKLGAFFSRRRQDDPLRVIDDRLIALDAKFKQKMSAIEIVKGKKESIRAMLELHQKRALDLEDRARQSVRSGSDDEARAYLAAKRDEDHRIDEVHRLFDAASDCLSKMKAELAPLVSQIERLKHMRDMAISKKELNDARAAFGDGADKGELADIVRAVDSMIDKADALEELERSTRSTSEDLERRYNGAADPEIEEELEKIRRGA